MTGHFSELLLSLLFVLSMGFLAYGSHIHNDALVQWGQSIAGQLLAALLTLMVASKKSADSPPKGEQP
jgi:hypothetical protein